jgi:DNA-binding GntR family transcriptional regulator
LHAQVYGAIKDALMQGVYRPGQKVTIRALASALGTSVMPVREALRQLATEGALDILPNRTVQVPVLTKDRLSEITNIRVRLEGLAARHAALRMGEQEIEALEHLQIEMAAARDRRDFRAYMAANELFHFEIYRGAGQPRLLRLIESMWLQCGPFMHVLQPSMRGIDRHTAAIDAIRARDCEAAEKAIIQDIERAARHLEAMLEKQPTGNVDSRNFSVSFKRN